MEGHTDNALPNARNDACNGINMRSFSPKTDRNVLHTSGYKNVLHLGLCSQVMAPYLPLGRGKERRDEKSPARNDKTKIW
jgi:hypothetical protein